MLAFDIDPAGLAPLAGERLHPTAVDLTDASAVMGAVEAFAHTVLRAEKDAEPVVVAGPARRAIGLARDRIELINADYINEAYERVIASDVRYRFVIDTATLEAPAPA